MTKKTPKKSYDLRPYAFDNLLILFWKRRETAPSVDKVVVNQIEIPGPLFGVLLTDNSECMLVASLSGLPGIEKAAVSIHDASGRCLATSYKRALRPLAERDIRRMALEDRMRIWRGLLELARKPFPFIGGRFAARIASSIAATDVFCVELPTNRFYLRTPWPSVQPGKTLNIAVQLTLPDGKQASGHVEALAGDGWVHCLVSLADGASLQDAIVTLQADDNRYLLLKIAKIRHAPKGRSDEAFIVGTFTQNRAALKQFVHRMIGRAAVENDQFRPTDRQAARYVGRLEACSEQRVSGWISDQNAQSSPVVLDLVINGRVIATQPADSERREVVGGDNSIRRTRRNGFEFNIPPRIFLDGTLTLSLFVSGTDQQVLGPAIVITPYAMALRSITAACEMLNDGGADVAAGPDGCSLSVRDGADPYYWARTQIMAGVLAKLREARAIPKSITIDLQPLVLRKTGLVNKESIVDIIVPVYRGRTETVQCIKSVLSAVNATECELIVVNDNSPDGDLTKDLRAMRKTQRFTLMENEANRGFVATVNRAMKLHPARDVILLNSDTIVPPRHWVDRLRRAAYSARNIGTVTPFSDNAEICSFPFICAENSLPEGLPIAELDALFAERNAGIVVDLPTAVGFCMYIKREALDEAGYFDELKWRRGYGEENDFCLKAAGFGWRHVAACDLFVQHIGGKSFGAEKEARTKQHLALLNSIYPDYTSAVHRFVLKDPLRRYRQRVIKKLVKRHAGKFVLFVLHTLGGGTSVAAEALAERLGKDGFAVLELVGNPDQKWIVQCFGSPYQLKYRFPDDFDAIIDDLRELGVWHIHYHQTLFFPKAIFQLPERLAVQYDYTVHDYLPICPRIVMIDETGYYCGESQFSTETCDRCIRYNGFDEQADLKEKYQELGGSVKSWRAMYAQFMKQARKVFFPSDDTWLRFKKHIRLSNAVVKRHPEDKNKIIPVIRDPEDDFPIAVIGGIGQHKGYDILLNCARSAQKEGLPLRFIVFGSTIDDEQLIRYGNVEITGPYDVNDLPALVEQSGCLVGAFLSVWPETFSYTLSEAWRMGLFPIAFNLGSIAERIRNVGFGRVIEFTQDPKSINNVLLEAAKTTHIVADNLYVGEVYQEVMSDYYELTQR